MQRISGCLRRHERDKLVHCDGRASGHYFTGDLDRSNRRVAFSTPRLMPKPLRQLDQVRTVVIP